MPHSDGIQAIPEEDEDQLSEADSSSIASQPALSSSGVSNSASEARNSQAPSAGWVHRDGSSRSPSAKDHQKKDEDNDESGEVSTGSLPALVDESTLDQVNAETFEELHLDDDYVQATQDAWNTFMGAAQSQEAAGEAVYAALFEGAPSLQPLFTTPRAVQAMKFMHGIQSFARSLSDPKKLKVEVETLAFGHLHLDVTIPRVVLFRDAILDLLSVELGEGFTTTALMGWKFLLNYVGGAIIFVKKNYAERINTLLESWRIVSKESVINGQVGVESGLGMGGPPQAGGELGSAEAAESNKNGSAAHKGAPKRRDSQVDAGAAKLASDAHNANNNVSTQQVPTTYPEMFMFNAVVMGFSDRTWFHEVLACFDNIVRNVANSGRLQEECDILVLRIARCTTGPVAFAEYKSCMLASLRSLLPKSWSTAHEVAWSWLWENVERLLETNMGMPLKWEKGLSKLLGGFDEAGKFELRKDIYNRFFVVAPAGQDYFKQSNTYLHFIAEKILDMTLEIFREPAKMVDDVSALGLRHVGYGIPTELFGPFVSACVEVLTPHSEDEMTIKAFRWSLGLLAKMLVRVILEGSTIVMKAINQNSQRKLKKAISCAPRRERANWMLLVQVGTQSISPLMWAISSGAIESAKAMIVDLLTIRADRDKYYYGADDLFARHPDIIEKLSVEAPLLLRTLFDGLIWRSRLAEDGSRRVNYYIKHLLVQPDGTFAQAIQWITESNNPKIVCHPVMVLMSDLVWNGVAYALFLRGKAWFLFTTMIFLTGQSLVDTWHGKKSDTKDHHIPVFCCRCFIYAFSLPELTFSHIWSTVKAFRHKETLKLYGFTLPKYLQDWQECSSLLLMVCLMAMLSIEPILWCHFNHDGEWYVTFCDKDPTMYTVYKILSGLAILQYFWLLIDLTVLSNRVSAFILVCSNMFAEVGLFIVAAVVLMLTFAAAISVLDHGASEFDGINKCTFNLSKLTLGMLSNSTLDDVEDEPVLKVVLFLFVICTVVFLTNLLIAQLTCSYQSIYEDMVGFARLSRMSIITETMPSVSAKRFEKFVASLELDKKLEFNSGDVGLSGGIQVREPSNLNPQQQDLIKRYGGSTSSSMRWPEDEDLQEQGTKFTRLEATLAKAIKRMTKKGDLKAQSHSGSGFGTHSSSSSSVSMDE